jgi:tripartite-type tricarboxylate transporter receptor subunit TctC
VSREMSRTRGWKPVETWIPRYIQSGATQVLCAMRVEDGGARWKGEKPYRGGEPTVTALLAGEIPLAFETMLALQPHVRGGTLRALAVTSLRRSAIMPDIPTTAEAGFPALVADNSYALFAPAGTPTPILARLHDATVAALALLEVHDRLREQGAEVVGGSPAELAAYVAAEIPKWATLAHQAGVKPE